MKKITKIAMSVVAIIIASLLFAGCSNNDGFEELRIERLDAPSPANSGDSGNGGGTNPPPGGG